MKQKYLMLVIVIFAGLLRLPLLDRIPPALYSDEVSQGYNAYSLLKTGKDEYGTAWPVSIRSFGDWKPPLQTYLMIPTIALFGLNAWGVRLAGALLGTLSIWVFYLLTKELNTNFLKSKYDKFPFVSAFLLAISPWHILFSRSAMMVGITLFFILLGLWSFLKGLRNLRYWYLSSICIALSIYGYYGSRVVVPLLLLFLTVSFWKTMKISLRFIWGPILVFLILLLPLGKAYIRNPNVLFGRVKTVSIFYDQGVRLNTFELQRADAIANQNQLSTFFHYLPYNYFLDIIRRFLEHLDGRFLFLTGDKHPPFQIPNMGVVYILDGALILIGIRTLLKKANTLLGFIGLFSLISILPAAFTFVTPSANRTFNLLLPLLVLASLGITALRRQYMRVTKFIIPFGYGLSFAFFLWNYTYVLPTHYAKWWHFGFRELYDYLETQKAKKEVIYISENVSMPYIFMFFYQKIDPLAVTKKIRRDRHLDEYGFEHVPSYGKYEFIKDFKWKTDKDRLLTNSLLVVGGDEVVFNKPKEQSRIKYPDGKTAFIIYEL